MLPGDTCGDPVVRSSSYSRHGAEVLSEMDARIWFPVLRTTLMPFCCCWLDTRIPGLVEMG